MAQPLKLTPELSKTVCEYAAQGMPLGRATALVGVNRVTAWRWVREGEAEIEAFGEEGEAELGSRGQFALDVGRARAGYLLKLNAQWEAAIKAKNPNLAKAVQVMLASQAPDEFSERRATRSIDQRTTLTGEVTTTNRYASMSGDDLDAEHQKITERIAAGKGRADDADWRAAAVRPPGQVEDVTVPGENNATVGKAYSGSRNRKAGSGALAGDDHASTQNISATRARDPGESVAASPSYVVGEEQAPGAHGERVSFGEAPSRHPIPVDGEDTSL